MIRIVVTDGFHGVGDQLFRLDHLQYKHYVGTKMLTIAEIYR